MLYSTPNPHGGDLYSRKICLDFSANINPYGTPEAVKQAVIDSVSDLRHYPDPYCRELVTAISEFEGVGKEKILCGNGAAELIFSFCRSLGPKKALILDPCFSEYETALRASACEVAHFALKKETDFQLKRDFLPVLERFDGEALMLCNPNNPTGQVISREMLEEILTVCKRRKIFLFIDECFLDLTDGGDRLTMKPYLETHQNLFLLKAFTKSYGMAGLRLGYCLCGNAPLLRTMGQTVQPWNVSVPAQKAGVAALKQTAFLEKAKKTIREQREALTEGLRELGLRVIGSHTNYILFYFDRELREPLLEKGIQIRSCANYPGLEAGWYRIAVKLPLENETLLTAFKEILR